MSALFEFGKEVLARQPFSALLGTELAKLEPGLAELSLRITERMTQQHGYVHGGVISYLADNCLTYAGGSVLGDSVTSEFKINYLRPAVGDQLIARSTAIACGRRQAVCQCQVFCRHGGQEKLVALAQGTIARIESGATHR